MTCRNTKSKASGSSGVQIPSRPSSLDSYLTDLIELAARVVPVLGVGAMIVGIMYLTSGDVGTGTIVGMIGVFILWGYYGTS